jgi:hypothetical protein
MLKLLRYMLAATVSQSNETVKYEKQHLSTTKKHQITLNKQMGEIVNECTITVN